MAWQIGFELPRSLTTPTKREEPQPKFMQFSEITKAEPEQRRRFTNVIARLLGLDTMIASAGDRHSNSSSKKQSPDRICMRDQNQPDLQQLEHDRSRPHLAAKKQDGMPSVEFPRDLVAQAWLGDLQSERNPDVEVLSFRKHPQEQQLQEFKREFAARIASQLSDRRCNDRESRHRSERAGERDRLVDELQEDRSGDALKDSEEIFDALRFLHANKRLFRQVLQNRQSRSKRHTNVGRSQKPPRLTDRKHQDENVTKLLNESCSQVKRSAHQRPAVQQTSENFCRNRDGLARLSCSDRRQPTQQKSVDNKLSPRQCRFQTRTYPARDGQERKERRVERKIETHVMFKLNSLPQTLSPKNDSTVGAVIQSRRRRGGSGKQPDEATELVKKTECGRKLLQELAERRQVRQQASASAEGDGEATSSRALCNQNGVEDAIEGEQRETVVRRERSLPNGGAAETIGACRSQGAAWSLERKSEPPFITPEVITAESRVVDTGQEKLPMPIERRRTESFQDRDPLAAPGGDVVDGNSEVSSVEKCDQPSPVSVLKTFLFHEQLSPPASVIESGRRLIKEFKQATTTEAKLVLAPNASIGQNIAHLAVSRHSIPTAISCSLHRRPHILYVRDILVAAGFTKHGIDCLRSFSVAHGLDPRLFRRLEHHYCHKRLLPPDPTSYSLTDNYREPSITTHDRRLLYDAVDRIILDLGMPTVEDYSWPRPAKPPALYMYSGKQLLQLIWTSIASDSALKCDSREGAIDDLLVRDLMRSTWVHSVSELEWIGTEIEAEIFDSVVIEAIRDFSHG